MGLPGLTRFQGDKLYGLPIARRRGAARNMIAGTAVASPPTITLSKGSGATALTLAGGGTGYVVNEQIVLAGGTSSYATILQVTAVSGGVITGIAIIRRGVYTVVPSNPVAQATSGGVGTGATFTMTYSGSSPGSPANLVALTNVNSAIRFTGNGPAGNGGGNLVGGGTACSFEWCTDAPLFDIRLSGSNTIGMLYIDGVRANDGWSTDASGAVYLMTVDWSGVRKPHTYKILNVNSGFAGLYLGNLDTAWYPTGPRLPLAWGLGDSYMYGTNATNIAMAGFDVMCELLGLEPMPDGIGSTGWLTTSTNAPAQRVADKLATLVFDPDYVFLDLGFNDGGGNMTTLATNFDATVAAVRAAKPKAKIIVFGPATPVGNTTNLGLVKAAVSARCTALGLVFIDVQDWVNSSNKSLYTAVDNTHPTQAGYDYIGGRKAQAVAAYL